MVRITASVMMMILTKLMFAPLDLEADGLAARTAFYRRGKLAVNVLSGCGENPSFAQKLRRRRAKVPAK